MLGAGSLPGRVYWRKLRVPVVSVPGAGDFAPLPEGLLAVIRTAGCVIKGPGSGATDADGRERTGAHKAGPRR
jgi:hypothetical protein